LQEKKIVNKTFELVSASKIHPSKILPTRTHGEKINQSVESEGILVPLIVRRLPDRPGEFELIDGNGRFEKTTPDQLVPIEIVEASDTEAFKISNATFQRKDRTTYERAEFYAKWLESIVQEKGVLECAQVELVRQVGCSEALISQYLAVFNLFKKLERLDAKADFSMLKTWKLNPLYQLHNLVDNPKLLQIVLDLQKTPDISFDDLKDLVNKNIAEQNDQVQLSEGCQQAKEALNLLPSDEPSDETNIQKEKSTPLRHAKNQPDLNKKLTDLTFKATQNLHAVTERLSRLINEIEVDTEKYATSTVLTSVKHVLKLLEKLEKYTDSLGKQTALNQNLTPSSVPEGTKTELDLIGGVG
jgi:ParB/RepB/Spo0J family partition protein